ncbi:hypothetical protein Vadar_021230 [Vaccinium darrowii]|uniref:Uncharacterized protein n=1 Tax=Vaccinium darrowii TaxID=229202 RepID=A0ACB7XJB7_9ERIC|nr:hypothetical protein Vadar_021230 [Vaccinium darrowii]
MQSTNVVLESALANPNMDEFSICKVVPRIIFRSLSVVGATLLVAMLPFFRGMVALLGAFACVPLDFIMLGYHIGWNPFDTKEFLVVCLQEK